MEYEKEITVKVNNKSYCVEVTTEETLAFLLREKLALTGTKLSCEQGECGACTVLLNGKAVNSCIVLAPEVDGAEVITIEGLAQKDGLDPVQQAFIDEGAVQCGFCTPGMIMSTKGLLLENPNPSEDEIKHALAGNLCRCTGYHSILRAVKKAAKEVNEKRR